MEKDMTEPTDEQVKYAESFFCLFDSDATIPVATQDRAWAYAHGKVLAQALRRERERGDGLETVLGVMVSEKDKAINILLDSYRALRLDHEDGKNITCPHCVQEEDCNEAERIQLLTPEKALYEAKVKELESQLSRAQRTERETAIVDELVTIYTDKAKDLLAIIVKKDAALRAIQGTCADDCDVHSECDVIQKALSLTPLEKIEGEIK